MLPVVRLDMKSLKVQCLPPASQAEVLDDVENFNRLFQGSVLGLLGNDEVYVDIGVDEISVCRPPHSAFDSHQAVLLQHI